MKRTFLFGSMIATIMFAMASCGGAEEETTDETTTNDSTEEVVEAVEYSVDTAASIINWWSTEEGEKVHWGTAKVLEGSFTVEGDVITSGALTINMNSVTADDEMGAKLMEHLSTPDFLDINQYATSTFTLTKHENGVINGTLNVAGLNMDVEAEASMADGVVTTSDFKVDMVQFPYFQTEQAEKPEGEWHNTMIGFNATIVGK